jgi:hypothetical protein
MDDRPRRHVWRGLAREADPGKRAALLREAAGHVSGMAEVWRDRESPGDARVTCWPCWFADLLPLPFRARAAVARVLRRAGLAAAGFSHRLNGDL